MLARRVQGRQQIGEHRLIAELAGRFVAGGRRCSPVRPVPHASTPCKHAISLSPPFKLIFGVSDAASAMDGDYSLVKRPGPVAKQPSPPSGQITTKVLRSPQPATSIVYSARWIPCTQGPCMAG